MGVYSVGTRIGINLFTRYQKRAQIVMVDTIRKPICDIWLLTETPKLRHICYTLFI